MVAVVCVGVLRVWVGVGMGSGVKLFGLCKVHIHTHRSSFIIRLFQTSLYRPTGTTWLFPCTFPAPLLFHIHTLRHGNGTVFLILNTIPLYYHRFPLMILLFFASFLVSFLNPAFLCFCFVLNKANASVRFALLCFP